MVFTVRQRARIAWFALFAMLASTLAPGVSHAAMAMAAGAPWGGALAEICSVEGPGWTSKASARSGSGSKPANHDALRFEHCPYCLPHSAVDALPAAPCVPGMPARAAAALPRLVLHLPTARVARPAAQPRAPPRRA
ncbi:MAG TPA: DUF2946 domain-containing protein [Burkholderiaceae bacterium]|jgi:hypothetical protein|nr:DUF2946 domain-containing protein [Burkholderiaceae bacterium]HRA77246.1 DUF2946 domain-containing protein [Burkholderiaceae bacterium]